MLGVAYTYVEYVVEVLKPGGYEFYCYRNSCKGTKVLNIKHFSFDKCPLLFPVVFLKMTMVYFLSGINSKIMWYCFRKYKLLGTEYFRITKSIKFLFFSSI